MCDIWKANKDKKEISVEEINRHLDQFKKLNVREVVLSGGEALMHSNLWKLCSLLKENGIKITLLSTGLLLTRHAKEVLQYLDEVIVSLDGSRDVHNKIRNIPLAFEKLEEGVLTLKELNPSFRITARCVLQHHNYFDFEEIVKAAKDMGLDQISFLAADVSSQAFNRPTQWGTERAHEVALNPEECDHLESIIENSFTKYPTWYESKFIAENPTKMRRTVDYYKALNSLGDFPTPVCNAPWVSAVVESNGDVMPCFFHKPYGNIYDNDFLAIINSSKAIAFRRNLKVNSNPVCKKCVCTLKLGITQ
jgi:MoaA/NifB/PqqE/SkfB family radical SAM enzyme